MQTVDINEAKTHLSHLVDQAANGKSFIISKAGKPLVKVVPLQVLDARPMKRIGFMVGQISIPDNFGLAHDAEINQLFGNEKTV